MTDAWDLAKGMADKHASVFVRLQDDGDAVRGVFVGEPHAREVHWVDGRFEECLGNPCPHCSRGLRRSFRVLFNLFVADEGVKIIEGTTTFFGAVLAAREKYGLEDWLFEIKRQGRAGDRRTKYAVSAVEKLAPDVKARAAAATLHDLSRIGKADEPPPTATSLDDNDRDAFF